MSPGTLCDLTILAFVSIIALTGCGGPTGPETVPVQGKLIFVKGGTPKALADRQGLVELESIAQPGLKARGAIQEDGNFTLATVQDGIVKPGAVAGAHRVRLLLDETTRQFVAPQFLSFEKSGLTVDVQPQAELSIKVWR